MELLLNLAWLLLLLPAYWLWKRSADARGVRKVSSLQCLLALGCAVVLLFPVISATDDLHAMRSEMEESSSSKRAVRQTGSDKSCSAHRLQSPPPAILVSAVWLPAPEAGLVEVFFSGSSLIVGGYSSHAGRSPPVSLLG
jgi:hypothetical protein